VAKTKKAAVQPAATDQRKKTERRTSPDRRVATVEVSVERREKVNRRRQIDPTTCERDYTEPEIEFMHALETYKRSSGRMFPTCSEVLEVLRGLGYEKVEHPLAIVPEVQEDCCSQAC
jgi:hypothetical protein